MRLLFGDFVLDRGTRQLMRQGRRRHLEPKAFDLLDLLLARRPEALTKEEIQDRLWPGTFVSETSLTGLMSQIRRTLSEDSRRPRFVRTVHGFGYSFCGTAIEDPGVATSSQKPAGHIWWDERAFPLREGENVLGRDEPAALRLNQPGVSRQHARIVVRGDQATLEDLGSKNGTFLREERIAGAMPLRDGDIFRLGRLVLEFRFAGIAASTQTEDTR